MFSGKNFNHLLGHVVTLTLLSQTTVSLPSPLLGLLSHHCWPMFNLLSPLQGLLLTLTLLSHHCRTTNILLSLLLGYMVHVLLMLKLVSKEYVSYINLSWKGYHVYVTLLLTLQIHLGPLETFVVLSHHCQPHNTSRSSMLVSSKSVFSDILLIPTPPQQKKVDLGKDVCSGNDKCCPLRREREKEEATAGRERKKKEEKQKSRKNNIGERSEDWTSEIGPRER